MPQSSGNGELRERFGDVRHGVGDALRIHVTRSAEDEATEGVVIPARPVHSTYVRSVTSEAAGQGMRNLVRLERRPRQVPEISTLEVGHRRKFLCQLLYIDSASPQLRTATWYFVLRKRKSKEGQ